MTITVDDARRYARKMLERESRGNGDQLNALDRVARRCQMSSRSLRRVISGERKDPGIRVFGLIRTAYLESLSRQISELQTELARETARVSTDDILSVEADLEDLGDRFRILLQQQHAMRKESKHDGHHRR